MHSQFEFLGWLGTALYAVAVLALMLWVALAARGTRRTLALAGFGLLLLTTAGSLLFTLTLGRSLPVWTYGARTLVVDIIDAVGYVLLAAALIARPKPKAVRA